MRILGLICILMIGTVFPGVLLVFAGPPSIPHDANSMWIEPDTLTFNTASTNVGDKFNVTVYANITSVPGTHGIGGWQFKMVYNNTWLNATQRIWPKEGTKAGQSELLQDITVQGVSPVFGANSVLHGEAWKGSPTTGPFAYPPRVGGLSIVEFQIIAAPPAGGKLTSSLDLASTWPDDTYILDYDDLSDVLGSVYNANCEYSSSQPPVSPPYLAIDPASGTYGPSVNVTGLQFNESISIKSLSAASSIVNASLKLHYGHTPSILGVRAVAFGVGWNVAATFDNLTYGVLGIYVETNAVSPPLSGDVLVAKVTFEILYQGVSPETNTVPLTFSDVALSNSTAQIPTAAPTTGSITVLGYAAPPPGLHDVAITDVSPARNWTYRGNLINVNVTAKNLGSVSESFNVTVYCDTNLTGTTLVVNLASGAELTLTFAWNTTLFAPFHNYTVRGETSVVPSDINTTNNAYVDGTIEIRIFGDVDGNEKVNIQDIVAAARAFGSSPGKQRWNPYADVNDDNIVNIKDMLFVAKNFK
jgi:hypothetical protein